MNKKTKKVDSSQLQWDWFENVSGYSSIKNAGKKGGNCVRTRTVLLYYKDVLDIKKTISLLDMRLSKYELSIQHFWYGAKPSIAESGVGNSHLLLQIYGNKRDIFIANSSFTLNFDDGKIILPLAVENSIRDLPNLYSIILMS
jgi:hypothetical protein